MSDPSDLLVQCNATHFTSFPILGSLRANVPIPVPERQVLNIVSYIGCSISIPSLILTILALNVFRYRYFRCGHIRPCMGFMHSAMCTLRDHFCVALSGLGKSLSRDTWVLFEMIQSVGKVGCLCNGVLIIGTGMSVHYSEV